MRRMFFFCLLFVDLLYCLDLNLPSSAVHNATSGSFLIFPSPANNSKNPALASSGFETSITYLFNLKEIPLYNVHFTCSMKNIGFYAGSSYLSHNLYKENSINFGFNCNWKNIALGSNIRYFHLDIPNYDNDNSYILDSGIVWNTGKISSGLSLKNVTRTTCRNSSIPVVFLWEGCWSISDKSRLSIGVEKENNFGFSFKLASRYDISKIFTLLGSYQYEPNRIGLGIVITISKIKLIYSTRTHQYLSLTHYVSIGYDF